jgi:hypothetical protein
MVACKEQPAELSTRGRAGVTGRQTMGSSTGSKGDGGVAGSRRPVGAAMGPGERSLRLADLLAILPIVADRG